MARSPEQMPTRDAVTMRYMLVVLRACGGNRSRAAEVLGIDRGTLNRWIKRARR